MLSVVKSNSIEELVNECIPASIKLSEKSFKESNKTLGIGMPESLGLELLKSYANENEIFKDYIGLGYYPTFVPPVILRTITENPGWYTSYTPYQAEISQGRLESLLNYQTMISELTGLPFSNASLLDEATAAGESLYLAFGEFNRKRSTFLLDVNVFPFVKEVIYTRAEGINVTIKEIDTRSEELKKNLDSSICGVYIQNPSDTGLVSDLTEQVKLIKENGSIAIMGSDLLSLMKFKSARDMGFHVCVGSSQRFGVPMMNGGPHAGFMAVADNLKRKIPGRIVGISKDSQNNPALRLSLQTREQHIKRERATSNICTAQALLANMAVFYSIFYGKEGLNKIADRVYLFTFKLKESLDKLGYVTLNNSNEIFDTIVIDSKNSNINEKELIEFFRSKRINLRLFQNGNLGISLNEKVLSSDVEELISLFAAFVKKNPPTISYEKLEVSSLLKESILRKSNFMNQDVFNSFTNETKILRYIYHLQKKDYSLQDGMIPLGSCTMKLNSASELIPITWSGFSDIHPFSPKNQKNGYKKLIDLLNKKLLAVTQMDCISLQPNSGANGEFAALCSIRAYYKSLGENNRTIVLIPSSAHGTNPASASIAGFKVDIVKSDTNGNIDIVDLNEKVKKYSNQIACMMITYPSTHGVFEETILEASEIIHRAGGQIYIDGANMNAQCGITAPGVIGGDICHLNLHKTFAIPHGGGGPGVGPICAKKHLEPFLPNHIENTCKNIFFNKK